MEINERIINPRYIQKKDEDDTKYSLRLIEILKTERPEDLEWDDIKRYLKFEGNKDSLRKANDTLVGGYAIHKYYKEILDKIITENSENDIIKEIEDKRIELKKEKIRVQDQRSQLNKVVREVARWENLKEEILTRVDNINDNYPLMYDLDNNDYYEQDNKKEALSLLSDFHYGIEIKNIINEYNPTIAKERINKLTYKTIQYCEINKIKTLNVLLAGDLLSGIIHNNLRLQNTEDIIDQIINLSEILAQMFTLLGKAIPNIKIHYTVGNHARISPNKNDSLESENFEYLLPWYLSSRLIKLQNVKIIKSKFNEIVHMNILGYDILGVHGQNDKLSSVIHDLTKITRIIPYMICFGHLHRDFRNEDGTVIVVNGSLSGIDEYAFSKRYLSTPHQKLVIFEEGIGEICTYKICF